MATINILTVTPGAVPYEVPQTFGEDRKVLVYYFAPNFNGGAAGALASDVLSVVIPVEWWNQPNYGFTVLSATIEQWTSSQAVGQRVKTQIPIASVSWREDTGVVLVTLGNTGFAGAGLAGNLILDVTMAGAVGIG